MNAPPKHTPAPWNVAVPRAGDPVGNIVITHQTDGLQSNIATLWPTALCPEHGDVMANAKVIGCAPDMADVLRKQIDALEQVIEILDRFAPDSTAARILHTLIDVDMAVLVKAGIL